MPVLLTLFGARTVKPASHATPMTGKRLFIFDGHSLCYQAFHGIPMLNAPDGAPVNAVYGFINTILKVARSEKPDYLAVVFDTPEATFRHTAFADYKAQRAPMPDEMRPQIPAAKELAAAAGIPVFEKDGFEADDLLATLAAQADAEGIETVLVTNDKDAKQLLSPSVRVYDSRKERYYTADDLAADTGLTPAQMVDFYCLTGDASDNVPGVGGVGPKTAQKLLAEHKTLEGIYAALDTVKQPALRERLAAARERVFANRDLIRLKADAPVTLALAGGRFLADPPEAFRARIEKLGFRRLFASLASSSAGAQQTPTPAPVFPSPLSPPPSPLGVFLAIDLQGDPPDTIGISREPGASSSLAASAVAQLAREKKPLAGWDLKRLRAAFPDRATLPDDLFDRGFDLQIAGSLLDPDHPPRSFEQMAEMELGVTFEEQPVEAQQSLFSGAEVAGPERSALAARRAEAAGRLVPSLAGRLAADGLTDLFRDVEMPLVAILAGMESAGVRLDVEALAALSRDAERDLARLEAEAHAAAGVPFNVASPRQLSEILFGRLSLPRVKKTKTGSSTDSDVLETLAEQHPLPGIILAWRQLAKLKSTYIDALPKKVDPRTGRLHTTLHQTGAATGRLSSSDPNLQNIPIRSDLGRKIRAAFLAGSKDHVLMSADYSQIEFRVLAHFSGDPGLVSAFREGRDVHVYVASLLYGPPPDGLPLNQVTDAMRQAAKGVAYSLIYGKTPFTLARDLKIPVTEASRLMDTFFREFSGVRAFQEKILEGARANLVVRTILGRLRRVPDVVSKTRYVREAAERTAVNAVIQGTAADLMKRAMIDAARALAREAPRTRILLQIHDELLLDVPKAEAEAAGKAVARAMERAIPLSVPLVANVGQGANWLEAHE